jgi:hypothetical protein
MSQKSGSDIVVYGCHAVEIGDVDCVLENLLLFLEIVKPLLVDQLPQELDGWLGAVLFLNWHVEIVDKNDDFWNAFRTDYMLAATFVQFSFNLLLHLRAGGSGTEHYLQESVLFVVHFERIKILDQSGLSSTSGTN